MSVAEILTTTAGGVRSALALLAIMAVIVGVRMKRPIERSAIYHERTTSLFLAACVIFSPVRAASLLGHPFPLAVYRLLDIIATGLGCIALIYLIASRAIQRGVPMSRVRRAMAANGSVVMGFILVAWTIR